MSEKKASYDELWRTVQLLIGSGAVLLFVTSCMRHTNEANQIMVDAKFECFQANGEWDAWTSTCRPTQPHNGEQG